MIKWQINDEKCVNCGKCIIACPSGVFQEKDGQTMINRSMVCIDCLHCAAVCPEKAVEFREPANDSRTSISHDEFESDRAVMKPIEQHIVSRRSYRNFKAMPVPREEIIHALEAASWAPSAKNEHPTEWMVMEGREKLEVLMKHILDYVQETGICPEIDRMYKFGKNIVMGKTNTIIIGHARTDATNPHIDTVLGLHSAELILQSRGIGTCWSGYLIKMCNNVPAIKKILQIPENNEIYGVLMVGYTENEEFVNVPNRLKHAEIKWI